jgi:hypothetical protein
MIRTTTLLLFVIVAITPATAFARGSGGGHSSGCHTARHYSYGSYSSALYTRWHPYWIIRVYGFGPY